VDLEGKADAPAAAKPPAPFPDAAAARLQGIEAALGRQAGSRPPRLLADFARAFHFGTPLAYFAGRSDDELAAELVSAFDFLDRRAPGEIRVRCIPGPGDPPAHHVVQATLRDQPFLLDTAREALRAKGLSILRFLHPLLRTERGDGSRLIAVRPRTSQGSTESFLHFEVDPLRDAAAAPAIEEEVRGSLREAAMAAEDFVQMRSALLSVARGLAAERPKDAAQRAELAEAAEFLQWLNKGNFIFLGYRAYDLEERGGRKFLTVAARSGLGILRDSSKSTYHDPVPLESLEPTVRRRFQQMLFPLISKTNRESRVHRRARMDYIGIKKLSPGGEVAGEHRFLGFFTSQALNNIASEIPVLRRKLAAILARAQVLEGSHDYKEIVKVFNGLPKEELLTTTDEEIQRVIETVMEVQAREGISVLCQRDHLGVGASVMVILPRDRFSSEARQRIQAAFARRFGSEPVYYRLALGDEQTARLHFYFQVPPGSSLPAGETLEMDVGRAVRTWEDRLREALERGLGAERGPDLARRLGTALPTTYRDTFDPAEAVRDLPIVEELSAHPGVRVEIQDGPARGDEPTTLLRFYRSPAKFYLSDVMPILTNLGLRVIDELTFRIGSPSVPVVYLHTIRVQDARAGAIQAVARERWPALSEAILDLIAERYENDGLGALVVSGALRVRQVELLRTYVHYFRQLRVPYAGTSIIAALNDHPGIAARLAAHFEARFRPAPGMDPKAAASARAGGLERSQAEILDLLDEVKDLAGDRILRGLLELINATVRTNYFQEGGGRPRIAIKLQSKAISVMPRPLPLFEIFVHNAEMEGIHLRSGKVARGGIRWSDRRDDFRTEVLGLMHTQLIKNAVIVPDGSKGGFVLKRPGESRDEVAGQVERQYRTLISGLLDLTDNLVDGRVVHPPETVIHDGPDPYLVVAADKGTATFSDLANSIAAEHRFWLGDAFASGGSHGYDHKKEGITARGAWECAGNHFRELGLDPDGEITVAGIGDMSGDVFGNGLLLSRRFKLLAAFDHRNIFLDPAPDPAVSFEERRRVFDLPRSSWEDYDPQKISAGGGVYRREAKRIALSPAVRALLEVTAEALTGEELVREVLKMPVDLLWNGGIGTYVRASWESNAEVGDSRNDAVRVTAAELRARVVSEGGNLGFTQAGRVEFALAGGKINTDFIDNSAGVDLSDHEVNIKIALAEAIRAGGLDLKGRDRLLQEMTAEVCGQVLRNNRHHAQILSLEEPASREDLADYQALAGSLAGAELLDAKLERFPDALELKRRAAGKLGLTRPELALLLSFAKIEVSRALRESSLVETPGFEGYLQDYFPGPIRRRFVSSLAAHPLRREVAVSALANELMARMGLTFVSRLEDELGVGVAEVVRAYRAADVLLGGPESLPPLSDHLAAGGLPAAVASRVMGDYRRAVEDVARWLLRTWPAGEEGAPAPAAAVIAGLEPAFREIARWLAADPAAGPRGKIAAREAEFDASQAPRDLAAWAARLPAHSQIPLVIAAARRSGVKDPTRAAAAWFAVAGKLKLEEVERAIAQAPTGEGDDRAAVRALLAELKLLLVDLTAAALSAPAGRSADPHLAVEAHLAARGALLEAYRAALPAAGRPFGLGSLLLLAERLRRLSAASAAAGPTGSAGGPTG
jgi:glutamate dehydrogenase